MYAGFITTKRVIKRFGIHQRFDAVSYKMIAPYLRKGTFPALKQIVHFEGINGPDGVKVKSLGTHDPSHMYDPITDEGEVPKLIDSHYKSLVQELREKDMVRASYDAAWMAHYIVDGLTPAHHYPYDAHKAELFGEDSEIGTLAKHWRWLGGKGVLSTHLNFEMGIASTLLLMPIRVRLDEKILAEARKMGPLEFFKREARSVAGLNLYERFYKEGWTGELARIVRGQIAPHATHVVGIVWLLAYLEASERDVKEPLRKQKK
jgi:hypothetical protein